MINFFFHLRAYKLPVTIRELLDLLQAIDRDIIAGSIDEFYQLARLIMIKDERFYDRFDVAFSSFLNDSNSLQSLLDHHIPESWLRKMAENHLTEQEQAQIRKLGGFQELMEAFKQRLKEQKERHQGGNKWIGTAGTSPFGAYGYNPEGYRIGQEYSRHQRAVKVWDKRQYRNLDEGEMLAMRNMTIALGRLKQLKQCGPLNVFDLESTITNTAKNAGLLDLQFKAETKDELKVLMLYDIGGSMDYHIDLTKQLFTAAKSSFKRLDYYYFHNCPYENLWTDNQRRKDSAISTLEVMRLYDDSYRLIIVGDAAMSPYELIYQGGSVEHMNDEAGQIWLNRIIAHFPNLVWLNPLNKNQWYAQSIDMINNMLDQRMYPLSIEGITQAINSLKY